MKDNEKVKVSKNEFAEVLYRWLSKFLNKDALEKSADEFGFKIRNEEDLGKILGVLAPFYMWLTVYTCERVFEDEKKRNDCLDIFNHLVYIFGRDSYFFHRVPKIINRFFRKTFEINLSFFNTVLSAQHEPRKHSGNGIRVHGLSRSFRTDRNFF